MHRFFSHLDATPFKMWMFSFWVLKLWREIKLQIPFLLLLYSLYFFRTLRRNL